MKIHCKYLCLVCMFVSFFIFSCMKDNSKNAGCSLDKFPLEIGNTWTYTYNAHTHFYSDSDIYYADTITIKVEKDTLYMGRTMKKIVTTSKLSPFITYSISVNDADAFRIYLSEPSSISLFRRHSTISQQTNMIFSPLVLDSVVSTVLSYTSSDWTFRENTNFKIDKSYQNSQQITTPAGTFNTCMFKWNYIRFIADSKPDINEYYTVDGLIKKTINYTNVDLTDADGNYLGKGNQYISYELIDYTVH